MFEGFGFAALLGINMAAAGIIAAAADSVTQKIEICVRRPPKRRRRRRTEAVCAADEELEFWGDEVPDEQRFYLDGQVISKRRIELLTLDGEKDGFIDVGVKGRVVSMSGDADGSVVQVAFMVGGEELVFDAFQGDVELYLQQFDGWRTLRMVTVGALVFDPLSFTWYYAVLPKLVPGHAGSMTVAQMTKKILWDVVVYGGVVAVVSVTANAALQASSTEIMVENEKRGITRSEHVWSRVSHDVPRLYLYAICLSIPADIPVFMLVPAKWQAAAFKFGDALFMLLVSYVVNTRVGGVDKPEELVANRLVVSPEKEIVQPDEEN
eukprot:TRINITY_DN8659_c0_g1_i1.p1 TRINITY_DN8659_c0_g1~~TRINITY_DN8659_c0_g1_i1.p1  ORF type:complete len:352 (+),score=67.07 TRINITY_DN8659_c0_g1_i1:88-1056(+)